MKNTLVGALVVAVLAWSSVASATDLYNKVPDGDLQYAKCLVDGDKKYEGATEASKIPGQTNVQAWCTCLWNETPENFNGDLVKFSESAKGAKINKMCEKYSGWEE